MKEKRNTKENITNSNSNIVTKNLHKKNLSKKNLYLDLTNPVYENQKFQPSSTRSYRDIRKKPNEFPIKNSNISSRNSSVKSKENHPPMKSILKQKKPKFIDPEIEDNDESFHTKNSFQTICMTELNESSYSKSKKSLYSQNSSSDEEINEVEIKKKPTPNNREEFNPLKIYLKLGDLLGSAGEHSNNNLQYNDSHLLNSKPIKKENYQNFKKNDLTTTDTSKEDHFQTKFNPVLPYKKNQK